MLGGLSFWARGGLWPFYTGFSVEGAASQGVKLRSLSIFSWKRTRAYSYACASFSLDRIVLAGYSLPGTYHTSLGVLRDHAGWLLAILRSGTSYLVCTPFIVNRILHVSWLRGDGRVSVSSLGPCVKSEVSLGLEGVCAARWA